MIGESTGRPKDPVEYPWLSHIGPATHREAKSDRLLARAWQPRSAIIPFAAKECLTMEAEQLNQIAAALESLGSRITDLRRYL